MKRTEKFLEFNGKRISVLLADGNWWVAVRPICEALNVDYHSQYKNLQEDEILNGVLSKQTTHDASNRLQEMICLPEKYVYGWLFTIRSSSVELLQYKKVCYDILYNHFHGTLTGRMTALNEKTETEVAILDLQERLENKLLESDEYLRIQELKKKQKQLVRTLKDLDNDLITGQLSLSFTQLV